MATTRVGPSIKPWRKSVTVVEKKDVKKEWVKVTYSTVGGVGINPAEHVQAMRRHAARAGANRLVVTRSSGGKETRLNVSAQPDHKSLGFVAGQRVELAGVGYRELAPGQTLDSLHSVPSERRSAEVWASAGFGARSHNYTITGTYPCGMGSSNCTFIPSGDAAANQPHVMAGGTLWLQQWVGLSAALGARGAGDEYGDLGHIALMAGPRVRWVFAGGRSSLYAEYLWGRARVFDSVALATPFEGDGFDSLHVASKKYRATTFRVGYSTMLNNSFGAGVEVGTARRAGGADIERDKQGTDYTLHVDTTALHLTLGLRLFWMPDWALW